MDEPRVKWWTCTAQNLPEYLKRQEEVGPDDYSTYLVEQVDGGGPRIVGSDGGEPEDQILGRDWAWVLPAIRRAYALGAIHGREASK